MVCGLACPIFTWKMICGIHAYYSPNTSPLTVSTGRSSAIVWENDSCASHYTGALWRLKPPSTRLFVQQFIYANIIALYYWSLVRGTTGERWISPHKGSVMRKMFLCHDVFMTPTQDQDVGLLRDDALHEFILILTAFLLSIVSYYHMIITVLMHLSLAVTKPNNSIGGCGIVHYKESPVHNSATETTIKFIANWKF